MTGCGSWFFFTMFPQKTNHSLIVILRSLFPLFVIRPPFLSFLSLDLSNLHSCQSILYREWREMKQWMKILRRWRKMIPVASPTTNLVFEVRIGSCLQECLCGIPVSSLSREVESWPSCALWRERERKRNQLPWNLNKPLPIFWSTGLDLRPSTL